MEPSKPWYVPDTPTIIALVLIAAVVLLAFMLAVRDPGGDMFKFMVGGLMTVGFASVISFYFGSSSGSKDKDNAIIAQMAPTNGTGNGAPTPAAIRAAEIAAPAAAAEAAPPAAADAAPPAVDAELDRRGFPDKPKE
jgi:hypothetical protein